MQFLVFLFGVEVKGATQKVKFYLNNNVCSNFWSVSLVDVFIAFCFCGRVAFLVEKKLRKKTSVGPIFTFLTAPKCTKLPS